MTCFLNNYDLGTLIVKIIRMESKIKINKNNAKFIKMWKIVTEEELYT